MTDSPLPIAVDPVFRGGGDAGALLRSIDWSRNPLGPIDRWPSTLRAAVGIMLGSRFAMRILWGSEFIMLHNDGYRPVLGSSKYPSAMGSRTASSFAEVWDVVGPMFHRVMAGETIELDDRDLSLDRNGYLEQCFFTLSYSPLSDDEGGIGGVLGVVYETTSRVLAERRLGTLRKLAEGVSTARSVDDVCLAAARTFASAGEDVPFALFYLRTGDGTARLAASVGLDDHPSVRPESIRIGAADERSWPLAAQQETRTVVRVGERFGIVRAGPFPEPVTNAVVLSLSRGGVGEAFGHLVMGVSPRRALDADYGVFFELAAEHVVAALANAHAIAAAEAERVRLQSFLLEAPAAIVVFRGPELVIQLANERYCRFVERPSAELVGRPVRAALPHLVEQGVVAVLDRIFATGEPFQAREFVADPAPSEGTPHENRYFDWNAQATFDAVGAIDGVMLFAVEVTAQVSARRAVEASRAFLEGVVNQIPAGIVIAEAPSGDTVLSNVLAATILGEVKVPESVDPRSDFRAFQVDGQPYTAASFPIRRALAGEMVREEEVLLVRRSGARRTLLVSAAPVYDADQRLVAGVSAFVDITDRKLTELALRDSEERGRAIVAALEEGIVLRDASGQITFANASAERLFGHRVDDVLRNPFVDPRRDALREDGTPYPVEEQAPMRALREGRPQTNDVMGLLHQDGRRLWVSVNSQPLFDGTGAISGVVSSFFDITERRHRDDERRALLARAESALAAAESASRAKDEFLAIVSHELRNPLNAMLGWTRMLRSGTLPPERAARALETIERNASSQAQLIEDLLDVSRVVSGKLPLDVQTVSLGRVVEAALDSAGPAIEAKGLRLDVVLSTDVVLSGDPARLQQVVWNLLTNATKFTPRGGTIRVVLLRNESHLELSVTDTGQGIEPSFLGQVFDRFKQADPSTTRKHGGLGLGLAIAKNLVEMHGGTIEARSEGLGHGATFVVRVPVAAVRRSPIPAIPARSSPAPAAFEPPPELRGLRVLVVDDEPDTRDLVAAVLGECGAVVTTTGSVAAAVVEFERAPPDVLLSDIGMPEEDGYGLIARIRALPRHRGGAAPAACLTGYTTAEDRRRALQVGFNMHLAKPIEPSELIAVVANLGRMARALGGS